MKVLICAAGASSRFIKAGFTKPKYELKIKDKTLFYIALSSLKKFFQHEFILILNKKFFNENFIDEEMYKLGIKKYQVVVLDKITDGQATTVYKAKKYLKPNDSIFIYNIDTYLNPKSIKLNDFKYDGCASVAFVKKGDRFSFFKLNKNMFAIQAAEKKRISNYASIGFYYFKKWFDYLEIYKLKKQEIIENYREAYITPMYQYMIEKNKKIKCTLIKKNDYYDFGTPEDIVKYDKNFFKNNKIKN